MRYIDAREVGEVAQLVGQLLDVAAVNAELGEERQALKAGRDAVNGQARDLRRLRWRVNERMIRGRTPR